MEVLHGLRRTGHLTADELRALVRSVKRGSAYVEHFLLIRQQHQNISLSRMSHRFLVPRFHCLMLPDISHAAATLRRDVSQALLDYCVEGNIDLLLKSLKAAAFSQATQSLINL